MTLLHGLGLFAAALLLGGGCRDAGDPAPPAASAGMAAPLSMHPDEILLDEDGERRLFGMPLEALPNAGPPLRMTIRYVVGRVDSPWRFDGGPVERARLLPGERALVTRRDRVLVELLLATGATTELDSGVEGAVGATPDGRSLVYCKGEPPDLEVWRLDIGSSPRQLTTAMAPAWSPGISEDGRTVVFVSGVTGVPAWWRMDGTTAPRQLTNLGVVVRPGEVPELLPFATGLGPTRVSGGRIRFEGQDGPHEMTLEGELVR